MALKYFYNMIAAGIVGGLVAHTVPNAIDGFKESFNQAQAEQRNKPWSKTHPRTDAPGTFTLYSYGDGAIAFGVYRNAAGKLDRDGLPALNVLSNHYQTVIAQGWYKDGKLHRDDGPALVQLDPVTGKITCEEWFLDGEPTQPLQRASTGSECSIPLTPGPTLQPL